MTDGELHDNPKSVFLDSEVEPQFLQVVRSATEYITFVTPYVILWDDLKVAILDAKNRKVNITFFLRKGANRRRPEDVKWLRENVKAYFVQRLHAKIYLNETTVLIASMNITAPSFIRGSKDFAMIVRHQHDATMFRDYVSDLPKYGTTQSSHSIGNAVSSLIPKTSVTQSSNPIELQTQQIPHCITCGKAIPLIKGRPRCKDCWKELHKRPFPSK